MRCFATPNPEPEILGVPASFSIILVLAVDEYSRQVHSEDKKSRDGSVGIPRACVWGGGSEATVSAEIVTCASIVQ